MTVRFRVATAAILAGLAFLACQKDPNGVNELSPATASKPTPPGHPGFGADNVALDGVPFGVAINDRNTYYVAQLIAGTLAKGTLPSEDMSARVQVGTLSDGRVFVFDRASLTAAGEIATGGGVRYLQFTQTGAQAVIANQSGWVNFVP